MIFKKKDELPKMPPEIKEKLTMCFLETMTKQGEQGTAGATLYATQITLNIMDESLQAIYKFSGEKSKLTYEQTQALKTQIFHKMLQTPDGQQAFTEIIKYLLTVSEKNDSEKSPISHF